MKSKALHFTRHYVEMLIAMFVGMAVLVGVPAAIGAEVTDWDGAPELSLLVMAVSMTVPMVAWMRYRGHGWAPAWEMAGAMFIPTIAAIALLRAGTLEDGHAAMMIQHVAMFPAMLAVMLLRLDEYTGHTAHVRAR
jgi:hypothetical protein